MVPYLRRLSLFVLSVWHVQSPGHGKGNAELRALARLCEMVKPKPVPAAWPAKGLNNLGVGFRRKAHALIVTPIPRASQGMTTWVPPSP